MTSSKKYKLFSAENAEGGRAVCAFFTSPAGCRNGDNCKFLHTSAAPNKPAAVKVEMSDDSSMSSESDGERPVEEKATPRKQEQTPKKQNKNKRKSMDENDIFSAPKKTSNGKPRDSQSGPSSNKKMKPSNSATIEKTPKAKPTTPKVRVEAQSQTSGNSFSSFVSNLPVASFSIPGATESAPTPVKKESEAKPPVSSTKADPPKTEVKGVLPTSTVVGRKWLKSVLESRKHDRYSGSFNFSRYKEIQQEHGIQATWIKTKPYGPWCKSLPQAIAIDCEMCETQDPLSGAKDSKALCRLSVINAEKPEEVLLDTLVKPAWPVTDYRTRINGIKKEHLENVAFTLRHAQAFMSKLCSEETVIVGHAVHNDLLSLNMEHTVVSDSSFLFRVKDSPTSTPSLKDCVKTILKKDMPDTHDSVNDARKALECVLKWVKNDGNVDFIERSAKPQSKGHQLFVHRIPNICNEEHLKSMFLKHTTIQPCEVDDIEFSGSTGKTHVSFKSPRHANLAFDSLDGTAEEEKSGRLQKKVYLRNGNYIRVRKMLHAKRPFNAKNNSSDSNNPSLKSP